MEISLITKDRLKFYNGKKVLLTGHTGFKGTWMSLALEQLGASIWGYSLPTGNEYVSDEFYREVAPKMAGETFGDIADFEHLNNAIKVFEPDIVFHLASHSSLYKSMEIPHHILQTNMMGALNVLEGVRNVPSVKAVVIVTSDKVYQNQNTDVCYRETSILGGSDPYSTSKHCQELLTECYNHTFFSIGQGIRVATARACNCIGPGDYNESRLFPYLVETFVNGQIPSIRNPLAVRPWQAVQDVIRGYLYLGRHLYTQAKEAAFDEEDTTFNFGPREDGFQTVGELTRLVSLAFGGLEYNVVEVEDRIPNEAKILKLDSTKAKKILGWEPEISFKENIVSSIDFIRRKTEGEDVRTLARAYIRM